MEDKHRHIDDPSRTSFGKAFTDHAWAEMRQLLDEEMPVVENKKRRFAWWWMWAAIGLVAGAAAFYFFQNDGNPTPAPAEIPVAALEDEMGKKDPALPNLTAELPETVPSEKLRDDAAKSFSNPENTEYKLKNTPSRTTQLSDIQTVERQENTLTPNTTVGSGNTLAILESPETNQSKAVEREGPSSKLEDLKLLSNLEVTSIENFPTAATPDLALATETFKPRRFGLSAYTTVSGSPQNSSGGAGAGILVDFPIRKSRLSLEAGLGYAAVFQPLDVVLLAEADETGYPGTGTAGGEELVFADGYVTFSNSVDLSSAQESTLRAVVQNSNDLLDLHYLQFPVELSYRHGRLRALAGVNAGLLLFSNSDVASGGIFTTKANEDAFNADFENNQGAPNPILEAKIKNFDFAAVGGVGFDFTPKIGLDLRYSLGLVDLVEDNYENKDYNRFFQATLRYRIK